MKLAGLISVNKDKEIIDKLVQLYPEQKKNRKKYKKALYEIRRLKPKKTDVSIVLERHGRYTHVSGIDNKDEVFAIEFTSWNEWVNMDINKYTIKRYPKLNILAHCLWEMTFCGFTNKAVKTSWKDLIDRTDGIIKEKVEK